MLLAACQSPPQQPGLVLVVADEMPPGALAGSVPAWSTADQPAVAHRHILTSTYSGARPNTLPQILSLYGHRSAMFVRDDFLAQDRWIVDTADHHEPVEGCLSDAIQQAEQWRRTQSGPHAIILHAPGAPCPAVTSELQALRGDEVWVIGAGNSGGPGHAPVALLPPTALPDATPSTLDILPTLLTSIGATVPSDARGMDLRSPTPRAALFFHGQHHIAVHTERHRLTAAVDGSAITPQALQDHTGAPLPLEDDTVDVLMAPLRAWHGSLSATTARQRLGQEAFQRMLQDGGYWEAPPHD